LLLHNAVPVATPALNKTVIAPPSRWIDLEISEVWKHAELLYFLIWRDVKVRYKQTVLGVCWVVLQPLLGALIFTIIFGNFAKMPSDGLPYPVFVYAGLVPWTFFATALTRSTNCLVTDAELIAKIYFPRLILPLTAILSSMIDFASGLVIVMAMALWFGITPTLALLTIPFFLLLAVLTALALALWLAPLNARYRDVGHTVPFIVQAWMFASPVVYPASIVPESWRVLYGLNPMVGVIEGFRWALLGNTTPQFGLMAMSAGVVALLTIGGIAWFKRMELTFADVL
jgi:lipopolysaccharide transport system permease protein